MRRGRGDSQYELVVDVLRGFAKLKKIQKSKKNWIELNPPTHPPIQIGVFFGNSSLNF